MNLNKYENGLRPLIKWELVALIVQFLVLVSAMAGSYAVTRADLQNLSMEVREHINQSESFLRVDVWETRNQFIDQKLDRIEQKLDRLLIQKR
jgi:hypothetical protein